MGKRHGQFVITAHDNEREAWNAIRFKFGGLSHAQVLEGLLRLSKTADEKTLSDIFLKKVRPRATMTNGFKPKASRQKKQPVTA